MFILSNLKLKGKIDKKIENGRITLEVQEDNIIQTVREKNEKVNYFVLENVDLEDNDLKNNDLKNNDLEKKDLENNDVKDERQSKPEISKITINNTLYNIFPCKNMVFNTSVTNEHLQENNNAELGIIFGTKRRKDAIVKSKLYGSKNNLNINIKSIGNVQKLNYEQILPKLNLEAKNLNEVFKIEFILEEQIFQFFVKKEKFDQKNCHSFLEPFVKFYEDKFERHFLILEGLAHILEKTTVRFRILNTIPIFTKEIIRTLKKFVNKKKLQPLIRDKFICTFYILLIMISGSELNSNNIPRFDLNERKFNSIFTMLGCRYDACSGIIRHNEMPKIFVSERIKKGRWRK
ncbi:hypothetical protein DMUE_4758 [Dictyocoela muelleri]|nr:hypothetical protein DMUE_4758 [Dictyocoela muelleri]